MSRCKEISGARAPPARRYQHIADLALVYVNLLLMLFSGAGLATSARLRWDASAYIPLRLALPLEYSVSAALLPLAALALLLLAGLAVTASAMRPLYRLRIIALNTYAVLMVVLMCAELCATCWLWTRVLWWLQSPLARLLLAALRKRFWLQAVLRFLGGFFKLPAEINAIIDEVVEDAPYNLYVAYGVVVCLGALQIAAVTLAMLAAKRPGGPRRAAAASSAPARAPASFDLVNFPDSANEDANSGDDDWRTRFLKRSEEVMDPVRAATKTVYRKTSDFVTTTIKPKLIFNKDCNIHQV